MNLSSSQLASYAQAAGFTGAGLATIVAIALAESGGNPAIRGGQDPRDRGVLQINSYWHPEVSDACAFDPACAFKAAFSISSNGTNFSQWTTFTNGAYKSHLSAASTATPGTSLGQTAATANAAASGVNPVQAIVDFFNGLSPALAWLSSPIRIVKMVAGVMLIAIALYLLIVPEAAQKVATVVKKHPELLAAA